MRKRVERPGVRAGYDGWAATYDHTPNPVVALDRRHTMRRLNPQPKERILDAGCGTGAHMRAMRRLGSRPVGLDFSIGMLRVARRANPGAMLVQADLNEAMPIHRGTFDAAVSSLVSEHLTNLARFFGETFAALRPGGRFVFAAFHPDPAREGVEANYEQGGTEYRLGAEPHTADDYLNGIGDAGFDVRVVSEFGADDDLVRDVPDVAKHGERPLLLLVESVRLA
jgi:SAM-dependent methyltransferase